MQRAAQQPVFTSQQLINTLPWVLIGVQMGLILVVVIAIVAGLGMLTFYNSERIMPGVAALGVDLGRLTVDEAAERLRAAWESDQAVLTVRDGERRWTVSPADLGLSLDAAQTAVRAAQVGRGEDGLSGAIHSLFNGRQVAPSVAVDVGRARAGFDALAAYVNLPARDADIRFNGADFQTINALPGRVIDTERMLSNLVTDPTAALAEGELNLSMVDTYPQITDVSEPLAAAQQLLGRSLALTVYDPISDEKFDWTVAPETLASWFGAGVDERRRVVLSLREEEPAAYLQEMAGYLGGGRGVDMEGALAKMRAAVADGSLAATLRVTHAPQPYIVQGGDTFMSIARKFGILPRMITAANPDVDAHALSVGQEITIPSPDSLIPLDPVPNKRVIVDMSDLHMYLYENGQLIHDWPTSTGIPSSPTNPGVFQVQGRYEMAYNPGWDLYMPHFIDVYEAAPGFFNGIHGLPNTGSGRLAVWGDALGNYDTSFGCIILGLGEAEWLYNWAEDGVIVEVRE